MRNDTMKNISTNNRNTQKGGDGGEIFIAARTIKGSGKINVNGGDGSRGGNGGKVSIITEDNQFCGEISADGGKLLPNSKWWEKTWTQIVMILGAIAGILGLIFIL